ncbi:hypothetical protein GII30_23170 [Gordonia amarae]|uniref:Uncharacterized protein n=1 Tax=Gordonia amarae TaxID=36821 RepID=A0A857KR31_9ACTN|nr:hypothetical protein GII35_23620 [Gordonia amarae]QHN24034.1 hypothetical protein GII34_23085 [Gordonia amarae]QHN32952.1 hypothetical protein GII32_23455 [Gordonia amarae]QHN41672.1 hypothetical protein GII30_23170 [Gordonia amarae]
MTGPYRTGQDRQPHSASTAAAHPDCVTRIADSVCRTPVSPPAPGPAYLPGPRGDPFGRRVGKTHTRRVGTILASTVLAWDGDQLIGQHHTDHGTGDQRSTVWTYHPGTDQPLTQHTTTSRSGSGGSGGDVRSWSQSRIDTEFHAIIADLADAPTELLDPHTGQVTGRASSTLWGATVWSGTGTDLRFAGQQYDRESGLHYNHHRHYNPHTATYTSADPLGVAPNPATATAYVHNPLTWIDPLGLNRNHVGNNDKGDRPGGFPDRHAEGRRDAAGNNLKGGLPRDRHGNPIPDSPYPHSQLGIAHGRRDTYPVAREFDRDGNIVKDIHWTDHGRPMEHTNPHQHRYEPNPTGGTPKHPGPEPLIMP